MLEDKIAVISPGRFLVTCNQTISSNKHGSPMCVCVSFGGKLDINYKRWGNSILF